MDTGRETQTAQTLSPQFNRGGGSRAFPPSHVNAGTAPTIGASSSGIPSALEHSSNMIQQLHHEIEILETRLQPVMRGNNPNPSTGAGGDGKRISVSPIEEAIRQQVEAIELATVRIQVLIDRLEI